MALLWVNGLIRFPSEWPTKNYPSFPTHKIFYFTFYIDIRHPLTIFISQTSATPAQYFQNCPFYDNDDDFSLFFLMKGFYILFCCIIFLYTGKNSKKAVFNESEPEEKSPKAFVDVYRVLFFILCTFSIF
jgi:hypothetical protein